MLDHKVLLDHLDLKENKDLLDLLALLVHLVLLDLLEHQVEEQCMYDGEEQHVLLDVNWCTVDEQLKDGIITKEEVSIISAFLMILNMVHIRLALVH